MTERPSAWNIHTMAYVGGEWRAPVRIEQSSGSNDQRVSTATDANGVLWVAYPS